MATTAGPAAPDVVTALTALLSVGVRPNDSSRVTAINIQPNGDSGTPVGPLPAKGFRTALTTLDIAVTTATGAGGAVTVGCAGCCTSALTALAARPTDPLCVGAGSSATLADSVGPDCTVWAAAVVFWVEPTAACVVLLDGCEPLDFFFFFGAGSVTAAFVSLESGCLVCDTDVPDAPDVLDGSADATPCPTKTAAPIPRATASPPIRPTYAPAPMPLYLTVDKSARPRLERIGLDCVAGR
jgi:hypothetical protein